MEGLEKILTRASEEQIKYVVDTRISGLLARQGHQLYLGKDYSNKGVDGMNYFWYNSSSRKLFIDFGQNLYHVLGNNLQVLSSDNEDTIKRAVERLFGYVNEQLELFNLGLIDPNDKSFGVPNKDTLVFLNKLKSSLKELENLIGKPQYRAKVGELFSWYNNTFRRLTEPFFRDWKRSVGLD